MDVDVPGHTEVHELAPEMFSRKDIVRGDDAVLQDFLLVINVVQKKIQRGDALRKAALQQLPLPGGNDAGEQIERKNLLCAGGIAIDVEGDALTEKGQVHRLALVLKLGGRKFSEQLPKARVVRAGGALRVLHLIEEVSAVITG